MSELGLKLIALHAQGIAPNQRTTFYREYWNVGREWVPKPKRTYQTVINGQEVTVKVLPSAMEATDEEWRQFTAIPTLSVNKAGDDKEQVADGRAEFRYHEWGSTRPPVGRMDAGAFRCEMNKPWRRRR